MRGRFVLAAVLATAGAWAQEQKAQPPPEFTGGYRPPTTLAPAPRAEWFAWADVALLVLVVLLAARAVLVTRSRTEVRVLTVFSVLYFGFYRLGCVCSVGSFQNVAYAATHPTYALPLAVAAFFLVPLVAALFVGRAFCGGACPMGAAQDLLLLRPLRVPPWLNGPLSLLPYGFLGLGVLFAATGTAYLVCEADPFVPFFRLAGSPNVLAFGAAMLLLSVFVGRPYCRFLCPYGVLLRWASALSRRRVRITPEGCVNCHLCADACPYDAIRPPADADLDPVAARRRLVLRMATLPAWVAGFALLGYFLAPTFARADGRVQRADELVASMKGAVPSERVKAWRTQGEADREAYEAAADVHRAFGWGAPLAGAWFGFVVGMRLVLGARRTRREEYEADASACFSCARCYRACPVPDPRLARLDNLLEGSR